MNLKSVLIIGGDSRIAYLAQSMENDGCRVTVFDETEPLKSAIEKCDFVILGLPASRDEKTVNANNLKEPIYIKDLFRLVGNKKYLFAGKMSERMQAVADVYNVKWFDYFKREEFELLNAVPTAEGAIQTAMEELPITLHGANVIVTGYGRIGKILAENLKHLGARVSVCARKTSARAEAGISGAKAFDFNDLPKNVENADVIFNTVPHEVIEKNVLQKIKNALVIDLASKPGGVDFYLDKVLLYPFVKKGE